MDNMMAPREFFEWYRTQDADWRARPWLIFGKGPSFARRHEFDLSGFNTFGLNHVILEECLDIAHAIDLDVAMHCADALEKNARYLLMPWIPHVNGRPGRKTLAELIPRISILARFASGGRLLFYNKSRSPPHGSSPPVPVVYFSAEAAYALLGMAGAHVIRSLGIDGGNAYAGGFRNLGTLLANGQPSFDKQFQKIAGSIMKYELDAAPLGLESPVRVYVAAMSEQMLAVKVLEYSIRKYASMSIEVIPMHLSEIDIPRPKEQRNWPRTPFSFQRFIIPQLAGYRGHAIYLDSDMQVFSDIRELWSFEMNNNSLLAVAPAEDGGRKPQYSVMLLDCRKLAWNIDDIVAALDSGKFSYEDLMYQMVVAEKQAALIPAEWNSLEKYVPGQTRLVHYTDMNTQPWIHARHPLGYLWVRDLLEAIDNGFIPEEYVRECARNGWIRPSLLWQVEHRMEDPLLLPRHILRLDDDYSPPYHQLHRHDARPWTSVWSYLKALLRYIIFNSEISAAVVRIKRRIST